MPFNAAKRLRSSAITMWTVRPLPPRSARFLRQAGNEPLIEDSRLAVPRGTAATSRRCARSPDAARRFWSRSIAGRPASSRWRRRARLASTSSLSTITRPTMVASRVPVIVNPNRRDDLSGLGHLAAVGLTFMTVVAVNRLLRARGFWTASRPEPDLLSFLDDVALGTVADVVPLVGLNRAFVAKGLIALRQRNRVGHTEPHGCSAARRTAGSLASRLPARPAHQCRRPHRPRRSGRAAFDRRRSDRGGAHRRRARPPQSRAAGDRNGDHGAGRSRGHGRARPRGQGRRRRHRRRRLASGSCRSCRRAAEGEIRPAGVRDRARARRHRHRLRPLDPRRRYRACGAPRGGGRASGKRRRTRHGRGRDVAQVRARAVARISGSTHSLPMSRSRAAPMAS